MQLLFIVHQSDMQYYVIAVKCYILANCRFVTVQSCLTEHYITLSVCQMYSVSRIPCVLIAGSYREKEHSNYVAACKMNFCKDLLIITLCIIIMYWTLIADVRVQ